MGFKMKGFDPGKGAGLNKAATGVGKLFTKAKAKVKNYITDKKLEGFEKYRSEKLGEKYIPASKKDKSPMKKRTYSEAKANDPKLDEYIKNRKNYKAGSTEYEDLQAKINAAYGTKRSEKIKASQVKRHKDDPSRTGDQNNKKDNTKTTKKNNEYIPQTVSPRKEYDPASRNKRKEYIPISQRK